MTEKVTSFTETQCAQMTAAINWMFGFINGTGAEVPSPIRERLLPLAEAGGMAMHEVERTTGEPRD
jgi:hypothetical protein